jgi:histidinol-phosphate aminotransferase
MAAHMNRRQWLRNTALLTGGITFLQGRWNSSFAAPKHKLVNSCNTDFEFAKYAPPELKARLFANENPFGPSDKAKKAIIDSLNASYQYPFFEFNTLAKKIADYEGIDPKMISLSAGSSPLLHATALYYARNGGNVISGATSYEDLPEKAEGIGAKWIKVPMTADAKLDLDAMEKAIDADTKLVYICNPNNPTGTVVDHQKLKDFCERVSKKTMVFVDEAYIDYLGNPDEVTLIKSVKAGQNIIVARTFSKLYGFAGLRIGYIVAQPDTLKSIEPYSTSFIGISAPGVNAALAAYQDKEFLQSALTKTLASRDYLYKVLKDEGYDYVPSHTNFVMFPLKMDSERFVQEMFKRGVGVRSWKLHGKDYCRISIGRMDEMQAFATAFKELS